jgi:transcriptional regulator with XRE-family HTH domain
VIYGRLPPVTAEPTSTELVETSPRGEIRRGDAYDLVAELPPASVDLIITSPPYWGLRTWGASAASGLRGDAKPSRPSALAAMGDLVEVDWSQRHTPPPEIGALIREHRLTRGLSLRGLASLVAVHRSTIWLIEESRRSPSRSVAKALAETLELCAYRLRSLAAQVDKLDLVQVHSLEHVLDVWEGKPTPVQRFWASLPEHVRTQLERPRPPKLALVPGDDGAERAGS